jgi:hypothetical protein
MMIIDDIYPIKIIGEIKMSVKRKIKKLSKGKTVLCLRTVKPDGISHRGFTWPKLASADNHGSLSLLWWDYNNSRYREEIAYVGENGIEPNVQYQLDNQHKFVKIL